MNLLQRLIGPGGALRYSLDDYAADVASFLYSAGPALQQTYTGSKQERANYDLAGTGQTAYRANGIVFACQVTRLMLFSEARFQFQQMRAGRPGDLFGTADLQILEKPWPNGQTGDLLARMIQDADLAGNAFVRRTSPTASVDQLERMRPDWTYILLGTNSDLLGAELLGYAYYPDGQLDRKPQILTAGEVAHWAPIPDPVAMFRGMSWLTPVIREVRGDNAATDHKLQFFEHAATPNMVVKVDPKLPLEKFQAFKAAMETEHAGVFNAYKTLYLGGGADATVVGANLHQMDFKTVQGAGETRIAAAAGVPPVIVGLSEGLAAATYSNYAQARRRFADITMRPLWRSAAGALAVLVPPPAGSRLWYDDRDIPALQEDEQDAATITSTDATTINVLVTAGYEPASVVAAVTARDMSLLVHTGKLSVQLKDPNDPAPAASSGAAT